MLKKVLIVILILLLLILGGMLGYVWYQHSHIFVEDAVYAKNSEVLDLRGQDICDALEKITLETLTPIEAMNELYRLKKMLN